MTTDLGHFPDEARIAKRSLVISGHRTSVSLEGIFWTALKEAARIRNVSLPSLVAEIDGRRGAANLSSAIRVYLFSLNRQSNTVPQRRA